MFFEVTAHPKPPPYVHGPCGSYGRISAKCKGEKVYIAASSVKECREYKSALLQLARRYSLPMREIHNLLLSSVLANIDTAEFDPDAPEFEFHTSPFELGEIPSPEANVNATKALTAYRIDIKVGDRMLEGADTFDLLAVSKNRRLWGEYWVVRHPNPEVRRKLAAAIVEAEKLDEEIFVKALRQLERAEAHGKATKQPLRRTIYAFDPWLALPQAQYSGRQLA